LSGSKSLFETSVKQNKPIVICVIEMKLLVLNNKIIGFAPTGADPGFQVRGGGALKKIAPSGGRREICLGISCENSRFYAKKADYRISLLPLTSNSKNKTVVSKLHCMSNL
jgi:hypothetical protein